MEYAARCNVHTQDYYDIHFKQKFEALVSSIDIAASRTSLPEDRWGCLSLLLVLEEDLLEAVPLNSLEVFAAVCVSKQRRVPWPANVIAPKQGGILACV